MHAISTITCGSTSSPVISRSIQTSRSSASEWGARLRRHGRHATGVGVARVDSTPMIRSVRRVAPRRRAARRATSRASWRPSGSTTSRSSSRRSIDEPEWFWDAVVRFLGIRFSQPYTRCSIRPTASRGRNGSSAGGCNLATICLDRYADDPARRRRAPRSCGRARRATTRTLIVGASCARSPIASRRVSRRAACGVGDAVGLFLPMLPETVAALFAVAKLGAVFLPIFSGYGADAVAVRLEDAGAVALVTADGFTRRGQDRADEGDGRRRGRGGVDRCTRSWWCRVSAATDCR